MLYELLDILTCLHPTALDDSPNLKEYHKRIESLEKVAAYLKSDKCIKYPLNGAMAAWGGKPAN